LFAFFLVYPYRQGGLGIANTLSATFNVGLLLYALRRKLTKLELGELRRTCLAILGAAVLAGGVAKLLGDGWEQMLGHRTVAHRIGHVFVPMGVATVVYFGAAMGFKVGVAKDLLRMVTGKRKSD